MKNSDLNIIRNELFLKSDESILTSAVGQLNGTTRNPFLRDYYAIILKGNGSSNDDSRLTVKFVCLTSYLYQRLHGHALAISAVTILEI